MPALTATSHPTPGLFFQTINSFQRTAALKAAIELRLFTAIADGNTTAASIATYCKVATRGARILADSLTTLGFLTKDADRYALTPDSALFLSENSSTFVGRAVDFLCSPVALANFNGLAARVRNGGAPLDPNAISDNPEFWVTFARSMAGLAAPAAQLLARHVIGSQTEPMKIIDIAAGHGLYGIACARQNPNACIIAQDFAEVLEIARKNATYAGVLARFETCPGNVFDVDLGADADLILLPNFLHHFDPSAIRRLLRKVYAALKPGGRVVTLEFIPNEDRISPPNSAFFSLVMLAVTPCGDAYTFRELDAFFRNAGFTNALPRDLMPGMQQLMISTR